VPWDKLLPYLLEQFLDGLSELCQLLAVGLGLFNQQVTTAFTVSSSMDFTPLTEWGGSLQVAATAEPFVSY